MIITVDNKVLIWPAMVGLTSGEPNECPSTTVCDCKNNLATTTGSAESKQSDLKVHISHPQRLQRSLKLPRKHYTAAADERHPVPCFRHQCIPRYSPRKPPIRLHLRPIHSCAYFSPTCFNLKHTNSIPHIVKIQYIIHMSPESVKNIACGYSKISRIGKKKFFMVCWSLRG